MTELMAIDQITPDTHQPRTEFKDEVIEVYAESIETLGQINPIEIDENNVIIRHEQLWHAAKKLGLEKVLVVRKTGLSQAKRFERQLADHDEDLGVVDKVWAYATGVVNINANADYTKEDIKQMHENDYDRLVNLLGEDTVKEAKHIPHGQSELSRRIGVKQHTISNYLAFFKVPKILQNAFLEKTNGRYEGIGVLYLSTIARLRDRAQQEKIAQIVIDDSKKEDRTERRFPTWRTLSIYVTQFNEELERQAKVIVAEREAETQETVVETPGPEEPSEPEEEEETEPEEPPAPPEPTPEAVETEAEKILRKTKEAKDKVFKNLYFEHGKGNSLEGKITSATKLEVNKDFISTWEEQFRDFDSTIKEANLSKSEYEDYYKRIRAVINNINAKKKEKQTEIDRQKIENAERDRFRKEAKAEADRTLAKEKKKLEEEAEAEKERLRKEAEVKLEEDRKRIEAEVKAKAEKEERNRLEKQRKQEEKKQSSTEPTTNQELIELGKRLGKDIRKALLKLDDDMKSSAPRRKNIACLLSLQMIKQNLNTGRVFNPKSPSTTLIWSNGDSLEDSIGELSEELEL